MTIYYKWFSFFFRINLHTMNKTNVLLIVDSYDDNSQELRDALIENNFTVLDTLNIKEDIDLISRSKGVSVLVCQFRRVKSAYLDNIATMVQNQPTPVILFTKDDSSEAIDKSVKIGVNAYIVDGFNSERIRPIIEVAISRFNSYQQIADELLKTRQQLEDRKLIDRAKGILMQTRGMDEQQAYKVIRKMAMDKSKGMGDIARSIIDVMEIMG